MVKTVKSFSLHLEEEDNTQFASAVYLRSYPNHVLTTWVFVEMICLIASTTHQDKEWSIIAIINNIFVVTF
jgi:hypothetical protein